jgi:hypothetical protein
MKARFKKLTGVASLLSVGLLAAPTSYAATQPASITAFTPQMTYAVLTAKSKGWRDPAFGDMGWTHSSGWGSFTAQKNQKVTITLTSATLGLHPGITVWYRGANDTAPNSYVVDHFYPQNANFAKFGATDESSGAAIGNIVMRHIIHGYDLDGNNLNVKNMVGITDGISGQLTLSFTARFKGDYIFVVGGFNPNAGVSATVKHNINTSVTVTAP